MTPLSEEQRCQLLRKELGAYAIREILVDYLSRGKVNRISASRIRKIDTSLVLTPILSKVLMLPATVLLARLDPKSYFTAADWEIVKENTRLNNETISALVRTTPYPDTSSLGSQAYWDEKAKHILSHKGGKKQRVMVKDVDSEQIIVLSAHFQDTYAAQGCRCAICGVSLTMSKQSLITNASVDRIDPGANGGRYEEGNIQITCIGCNMCKLHYPKEVAKHHIKELATAQYTRQNGSAFFDDIPPIDSKRFTKSELNRLVRPWCKIKLKDMYYHKFDKKTKPIEVKLTVDDLIKKVEERHLGNGIIQCHSGVRRSIFCFSFDRIDSDGDYDESNVRVILIGFNLFKNQKKSDDCLDQYCQQIKAFSHNIKVVQGVLLPFEE